MYILQRYSRTWARLSSPTLDGLMDARMHAMRVWHCHAWDLRAPSVQHPESRLTHMDGYSTGGQGQGAAEGLSLCSVTGSLPPLPQPSPTHGHADRGHPPPGVHNAGTPL